MPEFTCSKCGERVQSGDCPRCRAATAIATREHAEQSKVTPPASSDGAFREGEPPLEHVQGPSIRKEQPARSVQSLWKLEPSHLLFGCLPFLVVGAILVTAIALLLPAVQRVGIPSPRITAMNNMTQVALACHSYHDVHKRLPTPKMFVVKEGNARELQLSWRVSVLPYLEGDALLKEMDQTVGWDHQKNVPFQKQMPEIYTCPYRHETDPTMGTHFQYFTGPRTLFPDNAGRKIQEIPDGSGDTFLFAEADKDVVWSQPADMAIRPGQALSLPANRFLAAMADATVRMFVREKTSDTILRQLINANDQKPDAGWDR
jgi:hypothetical protein